MRQPGHSVAGGPPLEPPLYRPFARLGFASALLLGTPLGLWMLGWLYWSAPAAAVPWRLLHAHAQLIGFFGTLIPGMAQHVLARFAGRSVAPAPAMPWILTLLAAGLGLRVLDVTAGAALASVTAAAAQAAAFALFAGWVWRTLAAPPLAPLRRHLAASTAWLAAAMLLEAWLRIDGLGAGAAAPDLRGMRAVHALALYGGVLGWILGVLLRAGPMLMAAWRVPRAAGETLVLGLAAAAVTAAVGELLGRDAVARAGELAALGVTLGVLVRGGALRRRPDALPMLGRGAAEVRIFRLALGAAAAASVLQAAAAALSAAGRPSSLLTDAGRHLVTVGTLTGVVIAMTFRLVPVLEGRGLRWPGLRGVAFWALAASIALRTAEIALPAGGAAVAALVPLSGLAAWVAIACAAVNLARRP